MWRRAAAAGVVVAAAGGGVVLAGADSGGSPSANGGGRQSLPTATVRRRDLVETQRVDGTLGYSGSRDVANAIAGTYTWLPGLGRVIHPRETLWKVDARPVVLMNGALPAYRAMSKGDKGNDVLQLERGLAESGDAPGAVDGTFDANTAAAVRRWQHDHGLRETDSMELGRVVFLRGSRRVAKLLATVGSRAGPGPALTTTSTLRTVTVNLDAADQQAAQVGERAPVELPDGTTVPGRVAAVGRVASASSSPDGGGNPTIKVTVHLTSKRGLGRLDAAPVSVELARSRRRHVLAVPVTALVATRDGGYAVEVVNGTPTPRLVAVTPGLFAGGYVEVTPDHRGGLRPGSKVTVPS
jgi:hypothetical protein